MVSTVDTLERFKEVVQERHKYAQRWKEKTGQRVIGYTCTYVPEEIIYAAGMLPVRILGSHETSGRYTEPYMPADKWCAFSRDCLAQGLRGRYAYLDGLVGAQSCMQLGLAFFSWKNHVPVAHAYNLYIPRTLRGLPARKCLEDEIRLLKNAVEEWAGRPLAAGALERAIEICNENRRLLLELYGMKKGDNPPISGADTMQVVLASQLMDKMEHSALLRSLIKSLHERSGQGRSGLRLMLLGSEDDETPVVQKAESLGATVVIDEHCAGTRYFWGEVPYSGGDPLTAIASRYYGRPPCPTKDPLGLNIRLNHIKRLAQEYRIQGVLASTKKYCEPHQWNIPAIQTMLGEMGIPLFRTLQELQRHLERQ